MSTTDIVLIIGVLTTSVVTVINAIAGMRRGASVENLVTKKAHHADVKLDHITNLTNSTMSAAMAKIAQLEHTVERLQTQLNEQERPRP